MAEGQDDLTRKQERAVAALLAHPTVAQAAAAAGVSERSLYNWFKEPAFLKAYREGRRQLVEAALGQLQRATAQAVRTLVRNLKAAKASDQVRSALGILDRAVKAVELIDLEERVAELEQVADLERARGGGQQR
jgi:AcrR family transcriptional regulator